MHLHECVCLSVFAPCLCLVLVLVLVLSCPVLSCVVLSVLSCSNLIPNSSGDCVLHGLLFLGFTASRLESRT